MIRPDDDTFKMCKTSQFDFTKVLSIGETVKRAINISSGIGYHFDFTNLEFRSGLVELL
jgi:hypothetical protein